MTLDSLLQRFSTVYYNYSSPLQPVATSPQRWLATVCYNDLPQFGTMTLHSLPWRFSTVCYNNSAQSATMTRYNPLQPLDTVRNDDKQSATTTLHIHRLCQNSPPWYVCQWTSVPFCAVSKSLPIQGYPFPILVVRSGPLFLRFSKIYEPLSFRRYIFLTSRSRPLLL